MLVEVTKSFSFAHDGGLRVRRYLPGLQDLEEEVAATAIREGWARQKREALEPQKMQSGSPDNKMDAVESSKATRPTLALRKRKKPVS